MTETPLLSVRDLKKYFPISQGMFSRKAFVRAVDGVSFDVYRGETLSIVGESGCGKSTVSRAVMRLMDPDEGMVFFDGKRIDNLPKANIAAIRKEIQIVFQDPFSSLSPRLKVRDIIAEPMENQRPARSRKEIDDRVRHLLDLVGLPQDAMLRLPHEFSGGQRQRICIARALAPEPKLIVCDEAVSALDVSVKAQIVNLLVRLQDELGLALLFVSHDLAIVEHITHRVAVMYLGKVVEIGDRDALFSEPLHPYTQVLLSAVPVPDPDASRKRILPLGEPPSPVNPPPGCRFHLRCPVAMPRCKTDEPILQAAANGRSVACHLYEDAGTANVKPAANAEHENAP